MLEAFKRVKFCCLFGCQCAFPMSDSRSAVWCITIRPLAISFAVFPKFWEITQGQAPRPYQLC